MTPAKLSESPADHTAWLFSAEDSEQLSGDEIASYLLSGLLTYDTTQNGCEILDTQARDYQVAELWMTNAAGLHEDGEDGPAADTVFGRAALFTLPLASMTVGLPALVGSGVSLPLATLAALVPATMIAWSLPGMSAADVAAVRNTWLMDRAALLVLIAGMMALGAVMIPVYGTAGVAQALSVGGLGCFGVICGRLCGLRVGAAAPASYLFVCCAIGERAGGRLFFWQFPLMMTLARQSAVCVAVLVVSACVCRVPDRMRIAAVRTL